MTRGAEAPHGRAAEPHGHPRGAPGQEGTERIPEPGSPAPGTGQPRAGHTQLPPPLGTHRRAPPLRIAREQAITPSLLPGRPRSRRNSAAAILSAQPAPARGATASRPAPPRSRHPPCGRAGGAEGAEPAAQVGGGPGASMAARRGSAPRGSQRRATGPGRAVGKRLRL